MMTRLLFACTVLLGSINSWADVKTFVREYTYNASENDSKVSARKAAMLQLQSLVIQEVGVQVQSSFANKETLNNDEFSRQVQANYETFSQALTQTEIIEQSWDGEKFYLKAKITVDTDNLVERIKTVYVGGQPNNGKPVNVCDARRDQVLELLREVCTDETVQNLITFSKENNFDLKCNYWQVSIMREFARSRTHDAAYRKHLFVSVDNLESGRDAGELLGEVMSYALKVQPLSEDEVMIMMENLKRIATRDVYDAIRSVVQYTQETEVKYDSELPENERHLQNYVEMEVKIEDMLRAAKRGEMGAPESLSIGQVAASAIQAAIDKQTKLAKRLYRRYHAEIEPRTAKNMAAAITQRFAKRPDDESFELLLSYFDHVKLDMHINAKFYHLLKVMQENKQNEPYFDKAFPKFIQHNRDRLAQVISGARGNKHEQQLLLVALELPAEEACDVATCARWLFDESRATQLQGAEFLYAYGRLAQPAKDDVLKKLSRIKALKTFTNDGKLVAQLFDVLSQLEAFDEQAIDLFMWGMGDADSRIQKAARASLERAGSRALTTLKKGFTEQSATAQRRLIEVMGTFTSDKAATLAFLKTVQPSTPQMKFAIEDATAALTTQ